MSGASDTGWPAWTTAPGGDVQTPFDASVVVATILRPTLVQAVRSIFAQDLGGRIQIMIGIDKLKGDHGMIGQLQAECPSHCAITLCEPGYSTAVPNGGVYSALTGGGLLASLSVLANSRYVCYLDDDNWYAPEHISSLRQVMTDAAGWVHSLRWFVNSFDDRCIEVDRWHAAGPDAGLYASTMRGLVDTNCYMIDKDRCWDMLWRWSHALQKKGAGNDRGVFGALLRKEPWRCSDKPTVYYRIPPDREWVVHHWKWKGLEPRANTRMTPVSAVLAGIRLAIPQPPPAAAAPADAASNAIYEQAVAHFGPRSVIDLWTGDGRRALGLARAARAIGKPLQVLAVDTWLPVPIASDGSLRPLGSANAMHAGFCRSVSAAGLRDMITALPQSPSQAAGLLRPSNVRFDMLTAPADRGDTEALLRPWWPMIRSNGLVLLEPGELDPDEIVHRLADFAGARGARIGPVGIRGTTMIAIRKGETPSRRRNKPSPGDVAPAPAT